MGSKPVQVPVQEQPTGSFLERTFIRKKKKKKKKAKRKTKSLLKPNKQDETKGQQEGPTPNLDTAVVAEGTAPARGTAPAGFEHHFMGCPRHLVPPQGGRSSRGEWGPGGFGICIAKGSRRSVRRERGLQKGSRTGLPAPCSPTNRSVASLPSP